MLFRIRNLRLLAVIAATVILLLMLFARRSGDWLLGYGLIDEWHRGTVSHEAFLTYLVKRKLHEPIAPLDSAIKQFVKPEMDETGFVKWMKEVAPKQPLVGAGFVWHRGVDSLTIYPNTTGLDTTSQRLLLLHINTDYDLELNTPPQRPTWVLGYLDSLESVIRKRIGYSIYTYDFYRENRKPRARAEAHKTIFGLVWNEKFYADSLFPGLTRQIEGDSPSYGILTRGVEGGFKYWNEGILITRPGGDTLFQLGNVNLTPDSVIVDFSPGPNPPARFWKMYGERIGWMPGWKLYVQDRWNIPGMKILWKSRGDDIFDEFSDYVPFPIRGIVKNQTERFAHMAIKTLLWVGLAIAIFFTVIITEIRARNRQRDFIAQISHELRTPVAKLKLFAETLRHDRAASEAKENEYLDTILRESDHLSVLVDNTLNIARLDAGRLKLHLAELDLGGWLERTVNSQRTHLTEAGFEVKLEIEPGLPPVKADPEALDLVLRNLLDNAVKYSGEAREIEIKLGRSGASKVLLTVADRGLGIPASKRKAVFRRFYRIKLPDREPIPGAGVGLSLVREIVRAHRGKVRCEGRDGGGSAFVVELPGRKG